MNTRCNSNNKVVNVELTVNSPGREPGILASYASILYFMGKVLLTINWEPGFLFIGELGQQSKRWNLSVYYTKGSVV